MLITDKIAELEANNHHAGAFPTKVLRRIEELLPNSVQYSAETGCGKSTILLSNISQHHTVFCIEDREVGSDSSINFFEQCPLTKNDRVNLVLGPTQVTLPRFDAFQPYDVVLIDGPHGYPFPDLEYFYLYPHLRPGAILILDDVQIATIGRLADFVAEDSMFDFVELVRTTAIFRRTSAPTFDPHGDGWWLQDFNRRRMITGGNKWLEQFALPGARKSFADLVSVPSVPETIQRQPGSVRAFLDRHLLWRFKRR